MTTTLSNASPNIEVTANSFQDFPSLSKTCQGWMVSIMPSDSFDIIVVTDPRFQGGTGSAVAAEISAVLRGEYSVGLICYEAANIRQPFPCNARLQRLIDRRQLQVIAPGSRVDCRLAILHNPHAAGLLPHLPLGISAERRLVVLHHPPVDGFGAPAYDLAAVSRNAEEILAGPVEWAPVGPAVRAAFRGLADAPPLRPDDWANVLDFDRWRHLPGPRSGDRITIGRHSRADLRKFPASRDAFLQIYGDDPDIGVDLLGCPPELQAMLAPLPGQWRLRPFGDMSVRDYLDGLDVFVYYHRPDWIEAFGYAVIEAMARGVPCLLAPSLAPSFAGAARIEPPETALAAARELARAPDAARQAGHDLVQSRHSFPALIARLRDLIGAPHRASAPPRPPKAAPECGVLLISTNGVGMGHLTRTIAIARRLHAPFRPVIVSMSHGAAVAQDFGLHVEFIPYHNYLGADQQVWNLALRDELTALIDAFDARVVLFDGNSPFNGLIDALSQRPHVWSIWSRRGMWPAHSGAEFMRRESSFDAVLEPLDLASAFDIGPTATSITRTRHVGPVRLLDPNEQLSRAHARAELGLDAEATIILMQLGGGNNFDMRSCRDLVFRTLGGRQGVQIAMAHWKISTDPEPVVLPPNGQLFSIYPISRYLNAFDAMVSAAGYNSFHEATEAAIPAIYIPNENPSQDDQRARASFAARHGAAIVAPRDNPEALVAALHEILDPERRAAMSKAARVLGQANGAIAAAGLIRQLGLTQRGGRPGVTAGVALT